MKLKTIAIDDEPLALRLVSDYVGKTPFLELVGSFDNPLDAIDFLSTNSVDLILVDIQMPDLTGMFWTDAEPRLRALGWTGVLDKGPDVDAGGAQHNRVVSQNPSAGGGCGKDGTVTLKFGQ